MRTLEEPRDAANTPMSQFLSLVITGAVTGAIYSLLATGLTLSYAAFLMVAGALMLAAAGRPEIKDQPIGS